MRKMTTAVQIVMPQHCNGYAKPRLFGGQMMAWIDVVGAVEARRYTQHAVTTVCIDNLSFLKPALLCDIFHGAGDQMRARAVAGYEDLFRVRLEFCCV